MKPRALFVLACPSVALVSPASAQLAGDQLAVAEGMLETLQNFMLQEYFPTARLPPDFMARCAVVRRQLAQTTSFQNACTLIAETFLSVDSHLKLHPPGGPVQIEYGWSWRIIGDEAFVSYIGRESDAARKGLQLGDRVIAIEGSALNRASAGQLLYRFGTLAPQLSLQILVQSPGQPPRPLSLAAKTIPRARRDGRDDLDRWFGRVPLGEDDQRREESYQLKRHFHRIGTVLVWRPEELHRRATAVAEGLKEISEVTTLILDLRGQQLRRPETMLRFLDAIFDEPFEIGAVRKNEIERPLRVTGSNTFKGALLILTDSRTGGYAEVLARVVQQRQRGKIVGDRTLGRVAEEIMARYVWGGAVGTTAGGGSRGESIDAALALPVGEITLIAGPQLEGAGVSPDLEVLPKPAALRDRQDVVLTQALLIAQQPLSPEAAYQLLHPDPADSDREE